MFLSTGVNQKSQRVSFPSGFRMEKPSSYLKDNSIATFLPHLFAECLSKGCAVTCRNFLALIASYKELELLPPMDKHQTQTWICCWKMEVPTDTKWFKKCIVHPTIINAKLFDNEPP